MYKYQYSYNLLILKFNSIKVKIKAKFDLNKKIFFSRLIQFMTLLNIEKNFFVIIY